MSQLMSNLTYHNLQLQQLRLCATRLGIVGRGAEGVQRGAQAAGAINVVGIGVYGNTSNYAAAKQYAGVLQSWQYLP